MKKIIAILLMFHLFMVLSTAYDVNTDERAGICKENTISFPAFLMFIDEEAFAGTQVQTVIFQNGVQSIGSDAFGGADNLKDVFIPGSIIIIADSAFPKNDGLTIHGLEGSYVQEWAEVNGFDFVVDDIWTDSLFPEEIHIENLILLFWIICPVDERAFIRFFEKINRYIKSMRPQDRPELYPINYRFP